MINKIIFQKTLIILFIVELLSLNAFLFQMLMPFCFGLILLVTVFLSIKNLKYGLYIIFTELVIGSLGYLFWLDFFGFKISIRIGLWISVMLVWFIKFIINYDKKEFIKTLKSIKKDSYVYLLILLFISILFGVLNGYFQGNNFKNIFFDANGWIFFSLFFPCQYVLKEKNPNLRKDFFSVIFSASIFISIKTFFILYLFSHNFLVIPEIYRWIRDTRVGEITKMESGFFRVFFQSHIFILVAYFTVFILSTVKVQISQILKNKKYQILLILNSIFLSIIILGYSRSNWVGLFLGMVFLTIFLVFLEFKKLNIKKALLKLFVIFFNFSLSLILSLLLIAFIINFPIPLKNNNLNSISLITDRASSVSTEAGASSRWQLLPILWKEIKKNPVLGNGFGSTVTYISNDPRVREKNPSGEYTTFAFEWGWLDIWLKIGFIGLLVYLIFILNILKTYFTKSKSLSSLLDNYEDLIYFSFILGLIVICCVNFFSPYMNHPLGVGYIILIYLLFSDHFFKKI